MEKNYKKLPKVINVSDFMKILRGTKRPQHRAAFKLGFLCCLRISEVVGLQIPDIDRHRRMFFIRQGKGNKDRYVPIVKPLVKDLKTIPIKIGPRALQIAINKISEKRIGRKINFHVLRHSGATYYLQKGMNIRKIQNLLGHSRLDTTMIYTHVSPDEVKKDMDEIWK